MKKLVKKWLLEYACKFRYDQVLHWFASATDSDDREILAAVQTRSLLCTMVSIVTRGDSPHFDVAISVVQQLYNVSTGDVISHNKCIKLLTGLKVSFLAHLLKNRDAHVLDKVNQYFPRSPPRRNNDANLYKTLAQTNQTCRKFFLSLLANKKMCRHYMRDCFRHEFGPGFMTKLKHLANKFVDDLNSCLPPTVIEKLLASGAESELIVALSREKHAATELLIDLLHCHGTTGTLKEHLSQQDILDMLQLLQSPPDTAGMLGALATHWDSTGSDTIGSTSQHLHADTTNHRCGNDDDTRHTQSTQDDGPVHSDATYIVHARKPCIGSTGLTEPCSRPGESGHSFTSDGTAPAKRFCEGREIGRVTIMEPDRCTQGRIYKMKVPPPSSILTTNSEPLLVSIGTSSSGPTTSSPVNSQPLMVSSGTSSSGQTTTSIADSTQCDVIDSRHLQTGSEVIDSPRLQTGSEVIDCPCLQTGSEVIDSCDRQTGSEVIDSHRLQTGSGVIDSHHLQIGSEVIGGPRVQTGSEVIDSPRLQTRSEVIDSCHLQTGSEVIDSCHLQTGSEVISSRQPHPQVESSSTFTSGSPKSNRGFEEEPRLPLRRSPRKTKTNPVLMQQHPSVALRDEVTDLELSTPTPDCGRRLGVSMSDSLVSDSYSDINISSALLQTPDSATDLEIEGHVTTLLPSLQQYLKDSRISRCVVKLCRNQDLDMRDANQHVEMFS